MTTESELPGSDKILNESASIEILEGPSALIAVTIPDGEAVNGTDLEEESAWRSRADAAIDGEQTKVGSAVEGVQGVISARVIETPGYIHVVVSDGSPAGADNDQIAQAIYDAKCQGVITQGAESGEAINELGEAIVLYFDRVVIVEAFASVVVEAQNGASVAGIKQAIFDAQPTVSGQDAVMV